MTQDGLAGSRDERRVLLGQPLMTLALIAAVALAYDVYCSFCQSAAINAKVESATSFKRDDSPAGAPASLVTAAFRTAKDGYGTAEPAAPGEQLVCRGTAVTMPQIDAKSAEAAKIREALNRSFAEDVFGGYLGNVRPPFVEVAGHSYYNTGDLGHLVEGNLEGRRDPEGHFQRRRIAPLLDGDDGLPRHAHLFGQRSLGHFPGVEAQRTDGIGYAGLALAHGLS